MQFKDVVRHLVDQRYCTRASWNGKLIVTFGMGNTLQGWFTHTTGSCNFTPSMDDFKARDWMALPGWWDPTVEPEKANADVGKAEALCSDPYRYEPIQRMLECLRPDV